AISAREIECHAIRLRGSVDESGTQECKACDEDEALHDDHSLVDCSQRLFDYRAKGLGRSWKWSTLLVVPLPVSMWNGARVLTVAKRLRPFQPPFGLSIRPSIHLV